jgi:hypothetical protein
MFIWIYITLWRTNVDFGDRLWLWLPGLVFGVLFRLGIEEEVQGAVIYRSDNSFGKGFDVFFLVAGDTKRWFSDRLEGI